MTEPETNVLAPTQIDAAVMGVAGEILSDMRFQPALIASVLVTDDVAVAVAVEVAVGVRVGVGVAATATEKATEEEPEYPEYPPSWR